MQTHLTEVEYRLQRAEDILRRIFTEEQVTHLLDQNVSGEVPVLPPVRSAEDATTRQVTPDSGQTYHSYNHQQYDAQANYSPPFPATLGWLVSSGPGASPSTEQLEPNEGVYQTADYSDEEEFEWDEQERSSAGLGSSNPAARSMGDEEGVKRSWMAWPH
ncbi:hypothetical protein H2203_003863 [Taxawa tesnikishii (nom. ined.)]|nr:hypothetical protein H2203_003863 [Dothideales sp. JES 119]